MSASVAQAAVRLDIACGCSKPAGWVGIDVARVPGVDIVHDLMQFPWQVAANSVGEARCIHYVEHIPHREAPHVEVSAAGFVEMLAQDRWARSVRAWGHVRDLWFDWWEEVHRVLVPDGTITVVTPYYSAMRADQDPTHERRICERSYDYLSQLWLSQNRCAYPYAADFEILDMKYLVSDPAVNADAARTTLNAVNDLAVVLRALKPAQCWWQKRGI
mgnify:CR=1 FL=1